MIDGRGSSVSSNGGELDSKIGGAGRVVGEGLWEGEVVRRDGWVGERVGVELGRRGRLFGRWVFGLASSLEVMCVGLDLSYMYL